MEVPGPLGSQSPPLRRSSRIAESRDSLSYHSTEDLVTINRSNSSASGCRKSLTSSKTKLPIVSHKMIKFEESLRQRTLISNFAQRVQDIDKNEEALNAA